MYCWKSNSARKDKIVPSLPTLIQVPALEIVLLVLLLVQMYVFEKLETFEGLTYNKYFTNKKIYINS